jgi:hypothetical protein
MLGVQKTTHRLGRWVVNEKGNSALCSKGSYGPTTVKLLSWNDADAPKSSAIATPPFVSMMDWTPTAYN